MRPHPKIRKTVKWGGLVTTVLLSAVWVGSVWYYCGWVSRSGFGIGVERGKIGYLWGDLYIIHGPGLQFGSSGSSVGWWFSYHSGKRANYGLIPLWMPTLLTLLATAAAWRCDVVARRRARMGLCKKCNYDLAGIQRGSPCPECGVKSVAQNVSIEPENA